MFLIIKKKKIITEDFTIYGKYHVASMNFYHFREELYNGYYIGIIFNIFRLDLGTG